MPTMMLVMVNTSLSMIRIDSVRVGHTNRLQETGVEPQPIPGYAVRARRAVYAAGDAEPATRLKAAAEYNSLDDRVITSHRDDIVLIDQHDLNPGQRKEPVVVRDRSQNLLAAVNASSDTRRVPCSDEGSCAP